MNYNFLLPEYLQRPWYNSFKDLIQQIDNVLKSEEIERINKDKEIEEQIKNINITIGWLSVSINHIQTANFSKTTSLNYVPATETQIQYWCNKRFAIPQDYPFSELVIISAIRAQRYSGTQGGKAYLQIQYRKQDGESFTPIWNFEERDFNTNSYDADWVNCHYILYAEIIPIDLFDNDGEYNFVILFKSKDNGEVRVKNDRITLYYKPYG